MTDVFTMTTKQAKRQAKKDKSFLINKYKISAKRITAIAGNTTEYVYGEIWLVPPGAKLPEIQSTLLTRSASK